MEEKPLIPESELKNWEEIIFSWYSYEHYGGGYYFLWKIGEFVEKFAKHVVEKELKEFTSWDSIVHEFEDAIKKLDYLVENENYPLEKSKLLLHTGCIYYAIQELDEAEKRFELALHYNPKNFYALHAKSLVFYRKNKIQEALEGLNKIIKENKNDLLAYKSTLEILIDIDEMEEAEKVYKNIKELLKDTSSFPSKIILSTEFACILYFLKRVKNLIGKERENNVNKEIKEVLEEYENLLQKLPGMVENEEEKAKIEAIIRNSYACFLIDVLGKKDEGIFQLDEAIRVWPDHTYSLHKKISIYLEEETNLEEKEDEIREIVNKILSIDPNHHPSKRSRLILERKIKRWANTNLKKEFWKNICKIYEEYQQILEPEKNYLILDNAITHFDCGCLIWSAEKEAYEKGFLENKPSWLPSAEEEFRKSIEIVKKYVHDMRGLREDLRHHLIHAYHFLGSYLMTTAKENKDRFNKGTSYLRESEDLRKGTKFDLSSQNAYIEGYIGKYLRWELGEKEEGKKRLENAVRVYKKAWRAWWWLGRAHEEDREFIQAFKCFYKSANGQRSAKRFGELRGIVKKWVKERKCDIITSLLWRIKCSKKAYVPHSENPKNISDYAHDLYELGRKGEDKEIIKEAERKFEYLYKRYKEEGDKKEAADSIWYKAKCLEIVKGEIDREVSECYLETMILDPERRYEEDFKQSFSRNLEQEIVEEAPDSRYIYLCFLHHCNCYPLEDLLMKFKDVKLLPKNPEFLFRKTVKLLNMEKHEHISFITSLTSAIFHQRVLELERLKKIISREAKICSIHSYTQELFELNVWKKIFRELGFKKEAKNCAEEIIKIEPKNVRDVHIKISELKERRLEDEALSLMEEWFYDK